LQNEEELKDYTQNRTIFFAKEAKKQELCTNPNDSFAKIKRKESLHTKQEGG
jgi:hypothetical protein